MSRGPILVVDDHPANLKLCKVMLSVDGYEVHTAADAEEALAMLDSVRPRLILMDLQLPGLDGLELTRRLKADPATRDIVVVALTAYAMQGDEQKALEAGCDGYIAKPIDTRLLAATVERYLAQA
jgi:CheY-like chemotaxis protein